MTLPRQDPGWTFATLKEYFEHRFDAVFDSVAAQKEAVSTALAAADRAVTKAEDAVEKRLIAMNEFRAALGDQTANLMPRTEAETRLAAMAEKVSDISIRLTTIEGRGLGMSQLWGLIVGGVLAAIAAVMFVVNLTRAPVAPVAPVPIYLAPPSQGSTTTSQTTSRETPQ